jgi:hypothetical protein
MTERLGEPTVPVFNCVVHVAPPAADGMIVARVANLAGLEGRGKSEREALAGAVTAFKAELGRYHAVGQAIPWVAEVAPLKPGETQRLIAVHL